MENKSIYQILHESYKKVPQIPYVFQDPYQAGKEDIMCAFWENDVSYLEQEIRTYTLMDELQCCVEKHQITTELKRYLKKYSIASYVTKFSGVLKDHVSERIFEKENLYWLGIELATKSSQVEEVKLGILILGVFKEKTAKALVWIFGLHSEFTLYALEAANHYENRNEFVFELAKHTKGYGKMAALQLLQPITKEQQEWVMEKGADNESVAGISAVMCLNKAAMRHFYNEYPVEQEYFDNLSYLFIYAFAKESINNFEFCEGLVERYLEAAKDIAIGFVDLAALCTIQSNESKYDCMDILNDRKWTDTILTEIRDGEADIIPRMGMILDVLDLQPEFEDFMPLLRSKPFNLDILKYFMENHGDLYRMDVYRYLQDYAPSIVFVGEKVCIPDKEITEEYEADVWVLFLLQSFRTAGIFQESFCLTCVNARSLQVREEAIKTLGQFRHLWKRNEKKVLSQAILTEPNEELKKEIKQLMGEENEKS